VIPSSEPAEHEPRPSASLEASRARELARVKAMTAVERMELALELGRLCGRIARGRSRA
jgi:hypothetical protein